MFSSRHLILLLVFLAIFDFFVWSEIVFGDVRIDKNSEVYFLNIGQGDSELINLAGGVQILIDGGPNKKVLDELASILPITDRYIDLIVLSHPQYDHFAGLIDVLKRYQVGAFIHNGRRGEIKAFSDLEKVLEENKIKTIVLAQGDKIKYKDNWLDIISPNSDFLQSKELNDTSLVISLWSAGAKFLFTGDIGFKVEDYLVKNFDIKSDVLKVGHHGSKYSSDEEFLIKVNPKISVIEVGKNSYGHPTGQALNRLASVGSRIFRTDNDGTIKLVIGENKIDILKRK
ncbi:MAG: MBL fold metallo-hydrolase [Patescibacteria group bacterium]